MRNRLKVNAAVISAEAFLEVQGEFGSSDARIWQFAGSTIGCTLMQATDMVNDHRVSCFRHMACG